MLEINSCVELLLGENSALAAAYFSHSLFCSFALGAGAEARPCSFLFDGVWFMGALFCSKACFFSWGFLPFVILEVMKYKLTSG